MQYFYVLKMININTYYYKNWSVFAQLHSRNLGDRKEINHKNK